MSLGRALKAIDVDLIDHFVVGEGGQIVSVMEFMKDRMAEKIPQQLRELLEALKGEDGIKGIKMLEGNDGHSGTIAIESDGSGDVPKKLKELLEKISDIEGVQVIDGGLIGGDDGDERRLPKALTDILDKMLKKEKKGKPTKH